jgi:hypothetical protein
LPCEHHEVTHHHAFKHKSKFHESSINSRVFEALPRVFHPVDLNILLAIANMPAAKRRKVSGPIGQTKSQQSTITFSGTKAGRRTITSDEKPAKAAKAKIVSEAEEEVTTAPPPQIEPISIVEPESTAPIEGADLDDDQSLRMRPRLTFHSKALDFTT